MAFQFGIMTLFVSVTAEVERREHGHSASAGCGWIRRCAAACHSNGRTASVRSILHTLAVRTRHERMVLEMLGGSASGTEPEPHDDAPSRARTRKTCTEVQGLSNLATIMGALCWRAALRAAASCGRLSSASGGCVKAFRRAQAPGDKSARTRATWKLPLPHRVSAPRVHVLPQRSGEQRSESRRR